MCNCKKKINTVNEGEALQLIKQYAIDGEVISSGVRQTLYKYYDQIHNTVTPKTCIVCWDDYVKQKLIDIWIEKETDAQLK